MTPEQLGHRAAAQGDGRATCPFLTSGAERTLWEKAWDQAEAQRAAGRDPNGHPPIVPHVCPRNAMKVCNCCTACMTTCLQERAGATPTPTLTTGLAPPIQRVLWAIVRLATATERRQLRHAPRDTPCSGCGCTVKYISLGEIGNVCIVCGAEDAVA